MGVGERLKYLDFVIPGSASVSGAVRLPGAARAVVSVELPATWTAAEVGFEVSNDDFYNVAAPSWSNVVDADGADIQVAPAAGETAKRADGLAIVRGDKQMRIKSVDGTGVAVNQAAQRTVKVGLLITG